jgi:hypothetical protein
MTQRSQPAQDHVINFPTSDAGPYSADEWSDMFASLFAAGVADQGPLVRYLNELEVTDDAADIDVDTGGAIVNGHWYKNDAAVAFTIPHPAGNPRIDKVVVAVNNTAIAYAVSDLGFALDFPDVLADYNLTASIEPYSARLCIVQGTENVAPVAPGLDQNANHYMIPLYQYEISVAGVISAAVDLRQFCRFASGYGYVEAFVPPTSGWNVTDMINLRGQCGWGLQLEDAKRCIVNGQWRVPLDYAGGNIEVYPVFTPDLSANAYLDWGASYGACGQNDDTHEDAFAGHAAVAVTGGIVNCLPALTFNLTTPAAGDFVSLILDRDATDVLDTVAGILSIRGWVLTYQSNLL